MSRKNEFAASSPEILTNLQKKARLSAASWKHSESYNFTDYLPITQPLKRLYGPVCASKRVFLQGFP